MKYFISYTPSKILFFGGSKLELQEKLMKGYQLVYSRAEKYVLFKPALCYIQEINEFGHIRVAEPEKFILQHYGKENVQLDDLETLKKDLEDGRVEFEELL